MSGHSTTRDSRAGRSDTVPILEPTLEPTALPRYSRKKVKQQNSFGDSTRELDAKVFDVNYAAPTPSPKPGPAPVAAYTPVPVTSSAPAPAPQPDAKTTTTTDKVQSVYDDTNKMRDEAVYATSPRFGTDSPPRDQGQPRRVPPSSRGQSSRRAAALPGFELGSRLSTVPLDAFNLNDLDVDTEDVDRDDDIVAALLAPPTTRQPFEPGPRCYNFAPATSSTSSYAKMRQSYINFSDSGISSTSSMEMTQLSMLPENAFSDSAISTTSSMEMTQISMLPDNTFSAAIGAKNTNNDYDGSPQNSFGGESSNWFNRRSKSVTSASSSDTNEVEHQSYELGHPGEIKSAFTTRDSEDSYMSMSTFTSSRLDFNAQSQSTRKESVDGRYYPARRRGTGASNQFSNLSILSVQSDDSLAWALTTTPF
ncbi:unnamed protein product [Phytophthora fragariaefolia]|uniref:Unnamed protein product n=1 Tax=Phytophthora fragariaefolia TaxID=1490495 RepID=A0A9W7CXS8_9STRA|nr:unnamed protein product [Phytophthora fragariaefolia]